MNGRGKRVNKLRFERVDEVPEDMVGADVPAGKSFLRGDAALGEHIVQAVYLWRSSFGRRVVLETDRGLLRLNKMSVRRIVHAFGRMTEAWIGKRVVVKPHSVTINDRDMRVLLVEPAGAED